MADMNPAMEEEEEKNEELISEIANCFDPPLPLNSYSIDKLASKTSSAVTDLSTLASATYYQAISSQLELDVYSKVADRIRAQQSKEAEEERRLKKKVEASIAFEPLTPVVAEPNVSSIFSNADTVMGILMELWATSEDPDAVTLDDLLGPDASENDLCELTTTLSGLKDQWKVQVFHDAGKIFVREFPSQLLERLKRYRKQPL